MSRYIDVDEEIRKINEVIFEKERAGKSNEFVAYCFKMFANALSKAPTADVKKVRHAKWIKDDDNIISGHCSRCEWNAIFYETDVLGMPYCPNCGAKMDEETKE